MMPVSSLSRRLGRRRLALAALAAGLLVAGCVQTRFPDNPEAHPLYEEVQAAGPYYAQVRAGVKSRVLGLMPESLMRATLSAVEARWDDIRKREDPAAIAAYLRAHQLDPAADAIDETLRLNEPAVPAGGADLRLAAAAVTLGLVDAFDEAAL